MVMVVVAVVMLIAVVLLVVLVLLVSVGGFDVVVVLAFWLYWLVLMLRP